MFVCVCRKCVEQQRRKKSWKGCAFPGGHIELKESIVLSTIREIKEETGLDIFNLKQVGVKQWYNNETRNICFLFITKDFKGDLISTEEGENFWCNINDVSNLDLAYSFEKMFKLFLDENLNELYHKQIDGEITYEFY